MARMVARINPQKSGRFLLVFFVSTALTAGALRTGLLASPNSEHSLPEDDQTREMSDPDRDQAPPPPSSVDGSQISNGFRGHDRYFRVEYVYDGDSLRLKNGEELRMIGVDAPEETETYADQARAFVRKYLSEHTIIGVDFDRRIRDRYDRLLGYVYTVREREQKKDQTIMINERLIERGLAHTFLYEYNTRWADRLISAQREAIKQERNLFGHLQSKRDRYYRVHGGFRYHRPDCKYVRDIPDQNLDVFHSRKKALLQGYNAASSCIAEE